MSNLFQILVVEDTPDDFFLLERAFRKNGILNPLQWVDDGIRAIEYLEGRGEYADRRKHPLPRMIVLDLKLPRLGGLELLSWIKGHSELSLLPVLVMSSARTPEEVAVAYGRGANAYFVKPAMFEDLKSLAKVIHDYWARCVEPNANSAAGVPAKTN